MRSDKLEYGSLGYGDAPQYLVVLIGGFVALTVCGVGALIYLST